MVPAQQTWRISALPQSPPSGQQCSNTGGQDRLCAHLLRFGRNTCVKVGQPFRTCCRFSQALKLAQEHSFPSRDRPTAQHWAWWTCAQSHFFLGELELVGTVPQACQVLQCRFSTLLCMCCHPVVCFIKCRLIEHWRSFLSSARAHAAAAASLSCTQGALEGQPSVLICPCSMQASLLCGAFLWASSHCHAGHTFPQ